MARRAHRDAIGTGEAFDGERDFGAWAHPTPIQHGRPADPGAHLQTRQQVPTNAFHPGGERHPDAPAELGTVQLWSMGAKRPRRDFIVTSSRRSPISLRGSPGAFCATGRRSTSPSRACCDLMSELQKFAIERVLERIDKRARSLTTLMVACQLSAKESEGACVFPSRPRPACDQQAGYISATSAVHARSHLRIAAGPYIGVKS